MGGGQFARDLFHLCRGAAWHGCPLIGTSGVVHPVDEFFPGKDGRSGDGEIVVALIGTDATLKRFHREGNGARLEPANPRHRAIHVDGADLRIQGVVVGVQRILADDDRP